MLIRTLRRGFNTFIIAIILLTLAGPVVPAPTLASSLETGAYEETFSSNTAKHFVQGTDWNTWENRLRLDRLGGAEKWRPAISVGNDGYATVVWLVDSGSKADIHAQRIDPQGNRVWETDVIVNSGHNAGDWTAWADVAVDSQGNSIVAWVDRRDISTYIYAQRLSPTGARVWASDVRVSTSVVTEDEPSIVMDPADQAVIVWESYGSIYGQKLNSAGTRLWGGGIRLNASTAQWLEHPLVASWPDAAIAVIWQEDNSIHNIMAQRLDTNGNRLWASDMRVNSAEIEQTTSWVQPTASVGVDPNGDVLVAWVDYRAGTNIYAQRLNASGIRQWPNDQFINAAGEFAPGLSLDAGGNAYISWTNENLQSIYMQKLNQNGEKGWAQNLHIADTYGLSQDTGASGDIVIVSYGNWEHLFAQRVTTSGSMPWSQDVRVNYDSGAAGQYDLDLAPDNNGNIIAAWGDYRNNDKQIYIQKIDSNANLVWKADIRVGSGNMSGGSPTVAVDSLGNAAVVWYDWQSNPPKVYAQRLDAQGNRLWSTDVQVSSESEAASQYDPVVALDTNGNLVIAWVDARNGNRDIYVQKISTTGNRLWGADVRANSDTGASSQNSPAISVNGSNSIFVTWQDGRSSSYYDIFAQKLTAAGVKSWANDVRVNSDLGTTSHRYPDIAVDSIGNAVIVWADRRNGNSDIYSQKLDTSGNKLWSNDVRVNSDNGSTSQVAPSVASDTSNNTYTGWLDERNGYWDVNAQKLNASGAKLFANDIQINSSNGTVGQLSPVYDPVIAADTTGKIFAAWVDRRNGNLDVYAQRINSVGSRVWLADLQVVDPDVFYLPRGLAQSRTVDTISGDIRQATLTADYQANGGSVEFALSNNSGANWVTATLGTTTVFTTTGSDLRWRAVLTGDPVWRHRSPIVTSLRIDYSTAVPYADDYEADDDCTQAKPIATGGATQAHTFHQQADADWVWFDVVTNTTYIAQATHIGLNADLELALYDTCQHVVQNGDPSLGNDARLVLEGLPAGRYYLKVTNTDPNVFGADTGYTLSVRAERPNGLAVIVAGRLKMSDVLQTNINTAANRAYRTFLQRGYSKQNIYYLNTQTAQDVDGNGLTDDVDGTSSVVNVREAIQTWARQRGVALGVPLYVYMVDHGEVDRFHVDLGQTVTAELLNLWLGNLEATTGADQISVILEACYSGSFVDQYQAFGYGAAEIAGPNRVIVSSTSSWANAFPLGDGVLFSDAFWGAMREGRSVRASFQQGQAAVQAAGNVNCAYPNAFCQQPWLDDNGNGVPNETTDGQLAQERGLPATLGWEVPEVAALTVNVPDAGGVGSIQVEVYDNGALSTVEAMIVPPGYQPVDPGDGSLPTWNVPTVTLTTAGSNLFAGQFNFTQRGFYRVVAYARDGQNIQSAPQAATICVNCSFVYLPLVRK